MFEKIRRFVMAAVLAIAGIGNIATSNVSAHTYPYSHYDAPCWTGNESYNPRAFVSRPTSGSASYKKVQSTVDYASPLYACTNDGITDPYIAGWSLIVAVTGQGPSPNTFAQLGIANRGCYGVDCYGGSTNNLTDFWWTPTNNGEVAAATWVDFDSDGRSCPRDCPIVGHRYEFSIEFYTGDTMRFCVVDLTAFGVDCQTNAHAAGASYWNTAWWGFETWNDASALGNRDSGADIIISPLQYMNSNGSLYTTVTDNPNRPNCNWVVSGPYPAPSHWLSQHCVVAGGTGTTTINAYTAYHT